MTIIIKSTLTGLLQLFCVLLDVILGASISDHHQHLGDVPPHPCIRGEYSLVDVLQSDSCAKRMDRSVVNGSLKFSHCATRRSEDLTLPIFVFPPL